MKYDGGKILFNNKARVWAVVIRVAYVARERIFLYKYVKYFPDKIIQAKVFVVIVHVYALGQVNFFFLGYFLFRLSIPS